MLRSLIKIILLLPYKLTRGFDKCYEYFLSRLLTSEFASEGRTSYIALNSEIRQTVKHRCTNGSLFEGTFLTPNRVCTYRVNSFSLKEPEMLAWVDEFGGQGALFDIGANIGLYSIYYAKTKAGPVYAFEPSVFNLTLLARNIFINNVSDKVSIVSNPLSDANSLACFKVSSTEEGGAINAFGIDYGPDGKLFHSVSEYKVLGFSLDYLLDNKIISDVPSMIKIDVEGFEYEVLKGLGARLSDPSLHTLGIEIHFGVLNERGMSNAPRLVEDLLKSSNFNISWPDLSHLVAKRP